MIDTISRQAALDAIEAETTEAWTESDVDFNRGMDMAKSIVESLPSAVPKTGAWIGSFDGNECYWYCNRCKTKWYEEDLYMGGNEFPKFCPECGSEMHDCTTCKNMESDTGFCYEIADSDTHECHYERKEYKMATEN